MLTTALGPIILVYGNRTVNYTPRLLPDTGKGFRVDGRYEIILENIQISKDSWLEIGLKAFISDGLTSNIESGESLALISIETEKVRLSIGTEGDVPGIDYLYTDRGMIITAQNVVKIKKLSFYIAWMVLNEDTKESVFTWLAADPTIGGRSGITLAE